MTSTRVDSGRRNTHIQWCVGRAASLTLSALIEPFALYETEPTVVVPGFTSAAGAAPPAIANVGPEIFEPVIRLRRSASDSAFVLASFLPVSSLSKD